MIRVIRKAGESFRTLRQHVGKNVAHSRILGKLGRKRHFVAESEERRKAPRRAVQRERRQQCVSRSLGRA